MRALLVAGALLLATTAGALSQAQRFDRMMADDLYSAYAAHGPVVLEEAFPNLQRFEAFRKDFRDRVLTSWEALERDRSRAMFMLDVALATDPRHFLYWSDFLLQGQVYLRGRSDPPGANRYMDAFELLWNKTALAYLEGRRQPELVEQLATSLSRRVVPSAVPVADGPPVLVDPWILFTMGFVHEGYVLADAARFRSHADSALTTYAEAAHYDTMRADALVRSAGVLLRTDRPAEALAALDRFDEGLTDDGVMTYWARLLRAKALDALNRPDDSITAYQRALEIAPTAPSPLVGMMLVESRRGRDDAAEQLALRVRTARDPVEDPWWIYPHGDLRFYGQRLAALREMAR